MISRETHYRVKEAENLLYDSAENTPSFLNGVLVSHRDYQHLLMMLEGISFELNKGDAYEKMAIDGIVEDEKAIVSFINAILNSDISINPKKDNQ